MGDILEILQDALDFLIKAVIHYAQTPEGAKEFEEIYRKAETAEQAEAASVAQTAQPTSRVIRK